MEKNRLDMDRAIQFAINSKQELEHLDTMIGLEDYKKVMRRIIAAQKRMIISHSKGRPVRSPSFHMCFLGNPGTGKTSISHKTADILYRAGIVDNSKLMVAGRSDLVGEHVGETAIKTKKLLQKASGGVLLIDEAYALMDDREGSFGDEAINTLVEEMENCRDKLVIIFAGYPQRMKRFLANNPGLQSRIPYTVHFQDYTSDELYNIARKFAEEDGYYFHPNVREKLISIFDRAKKEPEFGNARYARNIIEQAESVKSDPIDIMDLRKLSDDDLFQLTAQNFTPLVTAGDYAAEKKIGFLTTGGSL